MFVKVSSKKDSDNGLECERMRPLGVEEATCEESWSSNGKPRPGPESALTTKVTSIEADPESSEATRLTTTDPTSSDPGVPNSVLLRLSRCSQVVELESAYVIEVELDAKVDSEKTKLYSLKTRATGGTCAFIGKLTLGTARMVRVKASIEIRSAIFVGLNPACTFCRRVFQDESAGGDSCKGDPNIKLVVKGFDLMIVQLTAKRATTWLIFAIAIEE